MALAELVELGCSAGCDRVGLDVFESLGGGEFALGVVDDLGGLGLDDLCRRPFAGWP